MTEKYGVIGDPIEQSLSPEMQNYWINANGIDAVYKKWHVKEPELAAFVDRIRAGEIKGVNVTVPHKERIIPLLDRLAPGARALGAVNTVVKAGDGALVGYNTDGIGFLSYLRQMAPQWMTDKPCVILGAGGAARAIIHALLSTPVPLIMVINRTFERAERLCNEIGRGRAKPVPMADFFDALMPSGLLVNSTSLGMTGQPTLEVDLSSAPIDMVVNDIVYKPLETVLLADAKSRGLTTVDGLGMLIGQGEAAFKLWLGPDVDCETGTMVRERILRKVHST